MQKRRRRFGLINALFASASLFSDHIRDHRPTRRDRWGGPLSEADHEMLAKAEAKRQRKCQKRLSDMSFCTQVSAK